VLRSIFWYCEEEKAGGASTAMEGEVMTKKLPRRWAKRVVVPGVVVVPRGDVIPQADVTPRADVISRTEASTPAAPDSQAFLSAGALSSGTLSSGTLSSGVLARAVVPATPVARALVVDDDPEIRRALARLLRPELDVHLAGSVAQAEALLARLDRVDLAFIDWELPDGTGEQILERLAHWPDAIRVLISARVSSGEKLLENRALANLVLGKPLALGVIDALKRAALALPNG
jgi:CheY-like chemotaxis protein